MERERKIFWGTLTSYLQYILQIALQITLSPIILKFAGQEVLGAYAILIQVIGYLGLLNLSSIMSTTRFLSHAYGSNDQDKQIQSVLAIGCYFSVFSNLIFSGLIIILSFWLGSIINTSSSIDQDLQRSMLLLSIWTIIKSPITIFGSALVATQNLAYRNIILLISSFVRMVSSIILVLYGYGLVGLIISNIIAEGIDIFVCRSYFKILYPQWNIYWIKPESVLFFRMVRFNLQSLLIQLSNRLVYYTDNITVGLLSNAATTSIYYSNQMPAMAGWNMFTTITDNSSPAITEIYARGDRTLLRTYYLRLHRINLLLVLPFAIWVYFFNESIINFWVGNEQYLSSNMDIYLGLFAILVVIGYANNAFIVASGKIRALSIISVTEGVFNILLSIVLGLKIGIEGVMLASVIAIIPRFIYLHTRGKIEANVTWVEYINLSLTPALFVAILDIAVVFTISKVWLPQNFIDFLMLVVAVFILHIIFSWFIGITEKEKKIIISRGILMLNKIK